MNPAILIVEDNEDDQFFMKRALNRAGILNALHFVEDGVKAVAFLQGAAPYEDRTCFPPPMIVFLDLKLPFLGGHDVLRWIREPPGLSALVVVIRSSSSEPIDLERAHQLRADHYLVKPTTAESLQDVVQRFTLPWSKA